MSDTQLINVQSSKQAEELQQLCRPGDNVLWVASSGGHLAEAKKLHDMMLNEFTSTWLTFDNEQSRSLLAGARVETVDYVKPRGLVGMAKAGFTARRLLSSEKFDLVISTGAAVAVPFLIEAAARGIRTIYMESLTRTAGPSLTGKIAKFIPGVQTYCQYESWSDEKWQFAGSILDGWEVDHVSANADHDSPLLALVSLGTIRPYRFDRAVDSLKKVLAVTDQTTWQLGATTRQDISEPCHESLAWKELGGSSMILRSIYAMPALALCSSHWNAEKFRS
ncbi:hypothetical protein NHF46_04050 [Arthrobacter alpinus]|nr:hypothetical protein [Arthrobacter alpinus]